MKEGVTSLSMDCRVVVGRGEPPMPEQISSSTVVYVALDDEGIPSPWSKGD